MKIVICCILLFAHVSCLSVGARLFARVIYDGTNFKGWQAQGANFRTVQQTLKSAFEKRFDSPVGVVGASRTDSGVHAFDQGVHFDLTKVPDVSLDKLQFQINKLLPGDLAVANISTLPQPKDSTSNDRFHALSCATSKLYCYSFCVNSFLHPMKRNYCATLPYPICLHTLDTALQVFVGTHDFSAFANAFDRTSQEYEEKNFFLNPVRTVNSVRMVDQGDGYYKIECHVNSALYRMIRNMVWTSVMVAGRKMDLDFLKYLIATGAPRHKNIAASAPPQGLCLEKVFYDNHYV